jgi:hypothetical protein
VTDDEIKGGLNDRLALGLTAWAEARGDAAQGGSSVEERLAVMAVCRNRAADTLHRWPKTVAGVCLQPVQFSCWNTGADVNHLALMAQAQAVLAGMIVADRLLQETLYLADGVLAGIIADRTGGANHYYAPKAMGGKVPAWAKGRQPVAAVGDQLFFRL